MSLFATDVVTSAVTLITEEGSSEATEDSATPTVSKAETEADNEGATPTVSKIKIEADDESATPNVCKVEVEANEEGTNSTVSKTKTESDDESNTCTLSTTLTEQILKEQTEETRLYLLDISGDTEIHEDARCFAWTVAVIVQWWQYYADDEDPTSYQIDFGLGSPINLLMALALLPEKYQGIIRVGDIHRSPFGNGENLSWLHEQTTDVLVGLSRDPTPGSILFGQGLASMVRDDVDEGWRVFTGRSWLEDQIHLWSNDELEADLYRFPPGTKKIIFFFNPTEIHWTVVEVDLDDDVWTYTLYNSLCQGERGPTWKACQEQFPLLEQLICRASGFAKPEIREIVLGASAQQDNPYDCGPIAIYNAIELLEGRRPEIEVDTEGLRLMYLQWIHNALYLLDQELEPPAFRARMRKVCLDNLI